jgi:hypothetical protein
VDRPAAQPFTLDTLRRCWGLAQGRCECQRPGHGHEGRCGRKVELHRHGFLGEDGWMALAWERGGSDSAENCEVLCAPCYRAVLGADTSRQTGQ